MALSELLIGALLILSLFTGAAVGRGLNLVWYRSILAGWLTRAPRQAGHDDGWLSGCCSRSSTY